MQDEQYIGSIRIRPRRHWVLISEKHVPSVIIGVATLNPNPGSLRSSACFVILSLSLT